MANFLQIERNRVAEMQGGVEFHLAKLSDASDQV
jgi:hypothetical protein